MADDAIYHRMKLVVSNVTIEAQGLGPQQAQQMFDYVLATYVKNFRGA